MSETKIYRLSTLNEGSWGAGASDDDVRLYCKTLAAMIVKAFPGVTVELVRDFVNHQCPEDLAREIRDFTNDNYCRAIAGSSGG